MNEEDQRTLTWSPGRRDRPGTPISGALPSRYEDLGQIAEGGTAEVRKVLDRHLHAQLAMKILRPDRATHPESRQRFLTEARLTATLSHPSIVAVQDIGELEDGRPWFTMTYVRGWTLGASVGRLRSDQGPTRALRRLVQALSRVGDGVAYAHSTGIAHCDLKPSNVMIGDFGEIRTMDWGLATRLQDGSAPGRRAGTPGYMAPEQARGEPLTARVDVYALGAMLYEVLSGHPPHGLGRRAWMAVLDGPPPNVRTQGANPLPEELCAACDRAMARDPCERPDMAIFTETLASWLEGERRRADAQRMVAGALAKLPEAHDARTLADELDARAQSVLETLAPHAPEDDKRQGWDLEDRAAEARLEARRLEAEAITGLSAALLQSPDLTAAHDGLADIYRRRLVQAERRRDRPAAVESEVLLRAHHRGRHEAWLQGLGALTLRTDPPGAAARLFRYERQGRRQVLVFEQDLGRTPLEGVPLRHGSYRVELRLAGHCDVHLPVRIDRLGHWDNVRPGSVDPTSIAMPRVGELSRDDCYVPAGWFEAGGDDSAADALPSRRFWVDAFIAKRFPVTAMEYLGFVNDLLARGEKDLAAAAVPVDAGGQHELFALTDGRYVLGHDPSGRPIAAREPMICVTAHWAEHYAASQGKAWRLPHDLEWEKLARGVDGRPFPWGWGFDPTWCAMQNSFEAQPRRVRVDSHPVDCSPYGARGLAGNVRDWCASHYERNGPEGSIVHPSEGGPGNHQRMVRGGAWASARHFCRSASRLVWDPELGYNMLGFRLTRSWSG